MPDTPITWPALAAVIATAGTILAGLWAVYGQIKRQFEKTRTESEARAVRTHERIDDLRRDIRDHYTTRELHEATTRRLDEALHERDRQLADIAARLNCPGPARHMGG